MSSITSEIIFCGPGVTPENFEKVKASPQFIH